MGSTLTHHTSYFFQFFKEKYEFREYKKEKLTNLPFSNLYIALFYVVERNFKLFRIVRSEIGKIGDTIRSSVTMNIASPATYSLLLEVSLQASLNYSIIYSK